MGYTHYWTTRRGVLSPELVSAVTKTLEICPVRLDVSRCDGERISLNGICAPERDDSHEDLWLDPDGRWAFCKTAQKPYDIAVTATLALALHFGAVVEVSSDGDAADWEPGVRLAREATGLDVRNPLAEAL